MSSAPRILFASENMQLGGLVFVELARLHREGVIELVAIWSDQQPQKIFPLDAAKRDTVRNATSIGLSLGKDGASFDGVYIDDYANLANELGITYQRVDNYKAVPTKVAARGLKLTAGVVCGHGKIFADDVLKAPSKGWVNLHPALLPKHRGPMPGFWELRAGDTQSGVSMHLLGGGVDEGPMIAQQSFDANFGMTFINLVQRQAEVSQTLIREHFMHYLHGQISVKPQPTEGASYEGMPEPEDYIVDPDMSCDAIGRFVLGLRGLQDVGVWIMAKPYLITGVKGWSNDLSGSPGQGEMLGGGKAKYRARDGWIELIVKAIE